MFAILGKWKTILKKFEIQSAIWHFTGLQLSADSKSCKNLCKSITEVSSQFHYFILESWQVLCEKIPAGIFLFKVSNGNTKRMCRICSKLTIKTPKRRHWHHSSVIVVNFEQVLHTVRLFTLSPLSCWLCSWLRFSD